MAPAAPLPVTLLDLPNAVLAKILALFADGSRMFGRDRDGNHVFGFAPVRGISNIAAAGRTCSQLAQIVDDPEVYVYMVYDAGQLLASQGGDLGALLGLLSRPRFRNLRVLKLRGLNRVSTKLVNGVRYRKALPDPGWSRLQRLSLHDCGVLATTRHILSLLPPSLRSFAVGHGSSGGRWLSTAMLHELANRCPSIEALNLGWTKAAEPWRSILEVVALRFPRLVALNIAYAGYLEAGFSNHALDACLAQVKKLKRLRILQAEYLGLDGSDSHFTGGERRAETTAIEAVIAELPDLAYISLAAISPAHDYAGNHAIATAFAQRIGAKHPGLVVQGGRDAVRVYSSVWRSLLEGWNAAHADQDCDAW